MENPSDPGHGPPSLHVANAVLQTLVDQATFNVNLTLQDHVKVVTALTEEMKSAYVQEGAPPL
eukprot:5020247-Pyramimonas_sp.AAC.1